MGFFFFPGAIAPAPVVAPVPPVTVQTYGVTLTAYNAVPAQTDNSPFVTASGAYSNPEVVAARSRDLAKELPFGTIIEIQGPSSPEHTCGYGIVAPIIGYRVIADTMNARYTDRIDILFSTKSDYVLADGSVKNAAPVLGVCGGTRIRVVGHVDINRIPHTQEQLATIVNNSSGIALK